MEKKVFLCRKADVPSESVIQVCPKEVEDGLAVYHVEGKFYATEDLCTHGMVALSGGDLQGTTIFARSMAGHSISAREMRSKSRALCRSKPTASLKKATRCSGSSTDLAHCPLLRVRRQASVQFLRENLCSVRKTTSDCVE